MLTAAEQGFTLIEVLMTMVIAVIVLIGGTYGLASAFKQNTQISDRTQNTSNAEVGLERLTTDLRNAVPCPTGLSDPSGNSLSGGLYIAAGPIIEMCDPSPGSHTTTPPSEVLVVWTCSSGTLTTGAVGTGIIAGSAGSCARTYDPITINSSTSATLTTAVSTSHIYGVKSLTLSGLTGSGSTASVSSPLPAPALYSLSSVSGISWIGITGQFYNLTDPSNPTDSVNSDIVQKTSPITVSTGADLRNYAT